jgi:3-oxoacyl-[acyl-carrier protein] reductase
MTATADAVAIVTGGCSELGRDVALRLVTRGCAIVLVYLEHQRTAEATLEAILAAGGTTVAVRADLADELDVERLFSESIAAFGGVDLIVHTTSGDPALLHRDAARHLRPGGAIVTLATADAVRSYFDGRPTGRRPSV